MPDQAFPQVSVLMPAYNYERYIEQALDSALSQDYPADRFEIVVVDDGSRDNTVEIIARVADANPGRIRLVGQENGGQISAVARARREAGGELLALLDADDVWLPSKLSRQVEVLRSRPEVSLVFCDMHVIDSDGQVIKRTLYEPNEFDVDRLYARILRTNVAYNSSLMFRATLFQGPPDAIEAWDWWLALCASREGGCAYIAEPLALYRQHGDNMLLGATGERLLSMRRRQLRFQLWAFRTMDLSSLTARELADIWGGPEWFIGTAVTSVGSYFLDLVDVTEADRLEAASARVDAERARVDQNPRLEAELWLRALAWNPYDSDVLLQFREALGRAIE